MGPLELTLSINDRPWWNWLVLLKAGADGMDRMRLGFASRSKVNTVSEVASGKSSSR